jgi:hypothetical protein
VRRRADPPVKPAVAMGPGREEGGSSKNYFENLVCIAPILHYSIGQHFMGSLKKRRKAKINKHKRRKKLRLNRHKKRTWQK